MKKIIVISAVTCGAVLTVAAPAHAEVVSLSIGNAIFAALYSVGVPGAVANFIAVNALGICCRGAVMIAKGKP